VILWVLGDSWTDPTVYPWAPAQGWPSLLAARLGLGLVNSGVSGTGYAATAGTPNFPAQAARGVGAGAHLVLVWGSLNDPNQGHTADETAAGAAATYALLRRLCPAAPLIVAGPQWGADPPPPELYAAREAVRAAAADAGATFLDPSGWLAGRPDLVLPDGLHPNPAGHALIADRITPELLVALAEPIPDLGAPWDDGTGWVAPYAIGSAATLPAPPIASRV
jgi:lysophospholipase L1-like esterase